jgi:hypothetical protein
MLPEGAGKMLCALEADLRRYFFHTEFPAAQQASRFLHTAGDQVFMNGYTIDPLKIAFELGQANTGQFGQGVEGWGIAPAAVQKFRTVVMRRISTAVIARDGRASSWRIRLKHNADNSQALPSR